MYNRGAGTEDRDNSSRYRSLQKAINGQMLRTTEHRVSSPNWYIYNTAPILKAQITS